MPVAVCAPYLSGPTEYLLAALRSAAEQLGADDELLVLPNGPEARATVAALALPERARVVADDRDVLEMADSWNRAFDAATRPLVHVLHYDDEVADGFYAAVEGLAAEHPGAGLFLTGREILAAPGESAPEVPAWPGRRLLEGDAAARFLMEQRFSTAGAGVFRREHIDRLGGFRPQYVHCPDEELFFRVGAHGGVAFDGARLYRDREHPGQTRFGTWRRSDFAAVYLAARGDGADHFGADFGRESRDRAAATVAWLARRMSLEGEPATGARLLDGLAAAYPPAAAREDVRASRRLVSSSAARTMTRARERAAAARARARRRVSGRDRGRSGTAKAPD